MYTYIASALIGAAIAATGTYKIQQWRFDANEKHHVEQHAAEERELSRMEQKRSANVIAAQNVARTREAKLRADAAGSRDALDGLRTQSDAAMLAAKSSHDACIVRADSFSVVLAQCATEYQTLGERADRHTSDIKTMMDAWPKE